MRQEYLLIGIGVLVALFLVVASYNVAPELLQVDIPAVDSGPMPMPSDGGDPGDGGSGGEGDPLPIDDPLMGIPPCDEGDSLLTLEGIEIEEEPFDGPDLCTQTECEVTNQVTGEKTTYSEDVECIKAGHVECEQAGTQTVTIMKCPGSVENAAACAPVSTTVEVGADCSTSTEPGCGPVLTSVFEASACQACWKFTDNNDRELRCDTSDGDYVSVNVGCSAKPPHPGQDGVDVDTSMCEYDSSKLE